MTSEELREKADELEKFLEQFKQLHDDDKKDVTGAGWNGKSDLPELFPRGFEQLRFSGRAYRPRKLAGGTAARDRVPTDPGDHDPGRPVRISDRGSGGVPPADRGADTRDHPGERAELELHELRDRFRDAADLHKPDDHVRPGRGDDDVGRILRRLHAADDVRRGGVPPYLDKQAGIRDVEYDDLHPRGTPPDDQCDTDPAIPDERTPERIVHLLPDITDGVRPCPIRRDRIVRHRRIDRLLRLVVRGRVDIYRPVRHAHLLLSGDVSRHPPGDR